MKSLRYVKFRNSPASRRSALARRTFRGDGEQPQPVPAPVTRRGSASLEESRPNECGFLEPPRELVLPGAEAHRVRLRALPRARQVEQVRVRLPAVGGPQRQPRRAGEPGERPCP